MAKPIQYCKFKKIIKKKRNGIEINMPFWVFFSYLWHLVLSIKENRKFLSFTIH